jgi:hypothetical protein
MKKTAQWLASLEETVADWWKTSRLRLPLSFFHHLRYEAWINGKRLRDIEKREAWHATLATRRSRLAERKRRRKARGGAIEAVHL